MKKLIAVLLLSVMMTPSAFASSYKPKSLQEIATFMSVDLSTLQSQLKSGLTIKEIAIKYGIDHESVRDFINKGNPNSAVASLFKDEAFLSGLANIFGISASQLKTDIAAGKSMRELAKKYGIEMVIVKGYLKTNVEAYKASQK